MFPSAQRGGKSGFGRFLSLATTITFLLIISTIVNVPKVESSQALLSSPPAAQYADNAIALISPNDTINLHLLISLTRGNLTVNAFESVIQTELLPLDIREVLLDIGWDNYSVGALPFLSWVDSWLTACDKMGVENLLYLDQLTTQGIASPWVESLISSDSSVQTFSSSGQAVEYVSPDNPDVATAIETDLSAISSYYGSHPSLVGMSTGVPYDNPYFATSSQIPVLGYSNFTLQQFASSSYFSQGVNRTGFHADGTADVIWSSFKNATQAIVLNPGNWMSSTRYSVYGSGSSQNIMVMQFYVPQDEHDLAIAWYGEKVGNPGQLQARIFPDEKTAVQLGRGLANASIDSSSVSTIEGWQSPLSFSGNFTEGYYWIAFSSPLGDSLDSYNIYMRDYSISNASASLVFPSGQGSISGSTILWEKDGAGNNLEIYPYQQDTIPKGSQNFLAIHQFSFNTVFLFLSDRHFNPVNATLIITDETDGATVAIGVLSQALTHGLQNWIPIVLDSNVTTKPGHQYSMSINESGNGYSWGVALRGEDTNPSIAGFQNQTQTWLFRLANTKWSQSHIDFTSDGSNGADSVKSSGTEDAVRIALPQSNSFSPSQSSALLSSIAVYMSNARGAGSFFGPGTNLTIAVREDGSSLSPPNGINSEPVGPILQSLTVPGQIIPQNGWLNVTGFDVTLSRGEDYWVVFNSSNGFFPMARLVSPYNFYELVSDNSGETWALPSEGPSELAIVASFSDGESVGNPVQSIPTMTVGAGSEVAQPFVASSTEQVNGVDIGPITSSGSPGDFMSISINPDNGKGQPSNFPIASGKLYSQNVTLDYGPQFVQFTSNVGLVAGQKYWIVLKTISGSFSVLPVVYSERPPDTPANFTVLSSSNGGYSWHLPFGNSATVLSYLISTPTVPTPEYNTSRMYQDLVRYYSTPGTNQSGAIGPWAQYVEASQAEILHDIDAWYLQNTGRTFETYTSIDSNLLSSLDYGDLIGISSNNTVNSCAGLLQYALSVLPTQGEKYHPVADTAGIPDCTNDSKLLDLTSQLNLMQFVGSSFGTSTISQRTLIVGGGSLGENLTNFLSAAFNTTFLPSPDISRLLSTRFAGSFGTIVWLSNSTADTPEDVQRILQSYVDGGGKLIVASQATASWMNGLMGFNPNFPVNGSKISSSPTNQSVFFNLLVAHTTYVNSTFQVKQLSSRTFVATDESISLGINLYGRGQVVSLQFANQSQSLDRVVLISNALATLSDQGQSSPFWYGRSNSQQLSELIYSVRGSDGGPLLLWISNPSPNPAEFSLDLNSTYYGIPGNWIALDPSSLLVISGNTTDIGIDVIVQPRSWEPIYIIPRAGSLLADYSNEIIQRQLPYYGQSLINLAPAVNQTVILVVSVNSSLRSVSHNDIVNLTSYISASGFLSSSQGWFFDNENNVVFVKFASTGSDFQRFYEGIQSQQATLVSNPITPTRILMYAVAILASAEISLFILSRLIKGHEIGRSSPHHSSR